SSAYIRQTELLLRDLFDQENLCKSTGQCTDESMSPRKDAITPLLTQSAKCEAILHRYVPIIMLQLEKLKPEEMCGMLGFCAAGIPL
ncbi:hypothetical protein B296_00023968, partial [Ensete ventricosum]